MSHNPEIDKIFDHFLPELDKAYSKAGLSLIERPLKAASFIVEHVVIEVEGCEKDDFLEAPWFAAFYDCAERWYENRYGDLSENNSADYLPSLVMIFDRWFLIHVPVRFRGEVEEDSTVWVYFPTKVRVEEDPFEWFVSGPNIPKMSKSGAKRASDRLEKVAAISRKINLNLWADFTEKSQSDGASHIKSHLATAAHHFSTNTAHGAQLAIWELHLAIEKSLKLWLNQRGLPVGGTHDLVELNDDITKANKSSILHGKDLLKLPSSTESIKYRYAELRAPSLERQREIYEISLSVVCQITDTLKRKYQFFDAGLKIKQPPWQRYQS